MADNTTLDAGSGGDTIGSDDISGVKYQRVKVIIGADGTNDGDVASGNPLPVTGTVTANLGATDNAVLDDIAAQVTTVAAAVSTEMQVDVVAALPAGTNNIGDVDVLSVVPGTGATNLGKAEDGAHTTGDVGVQALAVRTDTPANRSGADGDYEPLQVSAGRLWTSATVTSAIPGTGATNLGKAEDAAHSSGDTGVMALAVRQDTSASLSGTTGDYTPLQVNALGALKAQIMGTATVGGCTPYQNLDVDESEDEVKGTAGMVYFIHAINLSAARLYLKFYNATAATVVVGTTTPVLTFPIPTQGDTNGAGFTLAIPNGIAFGTALTIAATTGFAVADTGAPGANELIVNLGYA